MEDNGENRKSNQPTKISLMTIPHKQEREEAEKCLLEKLNNDVLAEMSIAGLSFDPFIDAMPSFRSAGIKLPDDEEIQKFAEDTYSMPAGVSMEMADIELQDHIAQQQTAFILGFQKAAEYIQSHNSFSDQPVKGKEAVEFSEWLFKTGWVLCTSSDEGKHFWQPLEAIDPAGEGEKTTAELYHLFTSQK